MVISLRINTLTKDFDFFLEVGHFQYYSLPYDQKETTIKTAKFIDKGISKNPDFFRKGAAIALNALETIDLKQCCIPLKILLFLKHTPPEII